MKSNFMKNSLIEESGSFGPEAVKIMRIPVMPNPTEAITNIRVAIFCIL